MLKKFCAFFIILTLAITPARAQTGLVVGAVLGYIVGSNSSTVQSDPSGLTSVLFAANAEVLSTIDPLAIRMVAGRSCFNQAANNWSSTPLRDLFATVTENVAAKDKILLKVVQIIDSARPDETYYRCGTLWFYFITK